MRNFGKIVAALLLFYFAFQFAIQTFEGGGWLTAILAGLFGFFGFGMWPTQSKNPKKKSTAKSTSIDVNVESSRAEHSPKTTQWSGVGESLKIQGRLIENPLVFHNKKGRDVFRDTLVLTATAAKPSKGIAEEVSYWPGYATLSTSARGAYLDWLAAGKTGPIDAGLMFIYFYGLERRAFLDKAKDEWTIIRGEMVRLLLEYGEDSRSIRTYLTTEPYRFSRRVNVSNVKLQYHSFVAVGSMLLPLQSV